VSKFKDSVFLYSGVHVEAFILTWNLREYSKTRTLEYENFNQVFID